MSEPITRTRGVFKSSFFECLICGHLVEVLDVDNVELNDEGDVQHPYNIVGGHVRIDFGYGSRFDILDERFYQAHICDGCFEKAKHRTRKVLKKIEYREIVDKDEQTGANEP